MIAYADVYFRLLASYYQQEVEFREKNCPAWEQKWNAIQKKQTLGL